MTRQDILDHLKVIGLKVDLYLEGSKSADDYIALLVTDRKGRESTIYLTHQEIEERGGCLESLGSLIASQHRRQVADVSK